MHDDVSALRAEVAELRAEVRALSALIQGEAAAASARRDAGRALRLKLARPQSLARLAALGINPEALS